MIAELQTDCYGYDWVVWTRLARNFLWFFDEWFRGGNGFSEWTRSVTAALGTKASKFDCGSMRIAVSLRWALRLIMELFRFAYSRHAHDIHFRRGVLNRLFKLHAFTHSSRFPLILWAANPMCNYEHSTKLDELFPIGWTGAVNANVNSASRRA